MNTKVAGSGAGQRPLNGPQDTGRTYRELSEPTYGWVTDEDVAVTVRDGVELMVDVYRPAEPGTYPVLLAVSPYPRQIQTLGAPLGFIEAGQPDFFVPRGYVYVIANLRSTGGSGGTFGFSDQTEREDCHDLVEWCGTQAWSDGNVGMIGISYFAMTQLSAAVEQPPHLKAIFPVAATADLFEAASHHGLVSTGFITPFLSMIGLTAGKGDRLWRSKLLGAARRVLHTQHLHDRFATMNGEAAMTGLKAVLKLKHDPHPWDDLWRAIVVEHPVRDEWWDERNLELLLDRVEVPVYLGCDWQNVPLHLPSTFRIAERLTNSPHVQVGMLDEHGLSWPWESLHTEALAWFDHWLKGRDTGILDGPPIRYVLPRTDGAWRTLDAWPPPAAELRPLALRADGGLAEDEGEPGSATLMTLGEGLVRPNPSPTDPPSQLTWTTEPLPADLDVLGDAELRLDASATAADTAWIVTLHEVDAEGEVLDVTAGYLRASLRAVDEAASRDGAPELPCRTAEAVPPGEVVSYRIPLVSTARRFAVGSRIRVVLTSDDQADDAPALMGFRHASVGTSSRNTVHSSSRLLLPVIPTEP